MERWMNHRSEIDASTSDAGQELQCSSKGKSPGLLGLKAWLRKETGPRLMALIKQFGRGVYLTKRIFSKMAVGGLGG
jgi:hypothetical protein